MVGCKCKKLTKEQLLYNLLYIVRSNDDVEKKITKLVKNYFKNEDENK